MTNDNKTIVAALNKILPTHYEMVLHSGLATPCISYMELTNYIEQQGDTLAFGRVQYQIKVWGRDLEEIVAYSRAVNAAMRLLGYKRISSGELYDNNSTMIQKIMTFEAMTKEEY